MTQWRLMFESTPAASRLSVRRVRRSLSWRASWRETHPSCTSMAVLRSGRTRISRGRPQLPAGFVGHSPPGRDASRSTLLGFGGDQASPGPHKAYVAAGGVDHHFHMALLGCNPGGRSTAADAVKERSSRKRTAASVLSATSWATVLFPTPGGPVITTIELCLVARGTSTCAASMASPGRRLDGVVDGRRRRPHRTPRVEGVVLRRGRRPDPSGDDTKPSPPSARVGGRPA
jgi:hypothetical protein